MRNRKVEKVKLKDIPVGEMLKVNVGGRWKTGRRINWTPISGKGGQMGNIALVGDAVIVTVDSMSTVIKIPQK